MSIIWGYILNATVYGSITGVVILFIRNLLKDRIHKKYTYLLWMILLIKLLFPFGPESSLSLFNKIPVKINHQFQVNNNMDNVSETTKYAVDTSNEDSSRENKKLKEGTSNQSTSLIENKKESSIFSSIIPIVWVSGMILAIISYIIIYLHFIKDLRKKENIKYHYLESILEECKEKLRIDRKISIIVNDTINSPSLIGVFKTRIIIPSNLIDLSKEELNHIFLHELCHYKSKDTFIVNLLVFLQCAHWFNPLVWYLFKHVRNDMEMACDERVLSVLSDKEHNKYGITMLTVLEKVNHNKKFALGLNMANDKKTIKKRIELIKNSKYFTKKKKILTITGISCLLIMCCGLLTNGKVQNEDDKNQITSVQSQDLDKAICKAIIDNHILSVYAVDILGGELNAQSHVILGKDEDDDSVEVYLMASYGAYSFENDIFNMTSGSFNIPIRMKFSKVKEHEFLTTKPGLYYLESEEAQDGARYKDSVLKMFPKKEATLALNNDYNDKLSKDMNKKAQAYVNSIGRKCKVTTEYIEPKYIDALVFTDKVYIQELYNYPDWIGTRETIEDGKRYIYETQFEKSSNILTFIKYSEDKEKLEYMKYEIKDKKLENIDI